MDYKKLANLCAAILLQLVAIFLFFVTLSLLLPLMNQKNDWAFGAGMLGTVLMLMLLFTVFYTIWAPYLSTIKTFFTKEDEPK